jgi:hypothetical protein
MATAPNHSERALENYADHLTPRVSGPPYTAAVKLDNPDIGTRGSKVHGTSIDSLHMSGLVAVPTGVER